MHKTCFSAPRRLPSVEVRQFLFRYGQRPRGHFAVAARAFSLKLETNALFGVDGVCTLLAKRRLGAECNEVRSIAWLFLSIEKQPK